MKEERETYLYAYYYTGGNHRMINLIPEFCIVDSSIELRDLEGFLETKIPLKLKEDRRIVDEKRFSITFKDEVAKDYHGKYLEINKDFNPLKLTRYLNSN